MIRFFNVSVEEHIRLNLKAWLYGMLRFKWGDVLMSSGGMDVYQLVSGKHLYWCCLDCPLRR